MLPALPHAKTCSTYISLYVLASSICTRFSRQNVVQQTQELPACCNLCQSDTSWVLLISHHAKSSLAASRALYIDSKPILPRSPPHISTRVKIWCYYCHTGISACSKSLAPKLTTKVVLVTKQICHKERDKTYQNTA